MMEEWIARRIENPHILRPHPRSRQRQYIYVVTEYIDGKTLTQWMTDNPQPDIESVRDIVEQIANGLRAFHRMEMLHQDIRPDNIMIDKAGTVKIIDFGSVQVAGVLEADPHGAGAILGTVQYTAPEYFRGEGGTPASDMFSLGVIAYQMLTGRLPYGTQVATLRPGSRKKLAYRSACEDDRNIPKWIDGAIRKAIDPDPRKRYEDLSEFMFDLRHPNPKYVSSREPLLQRNPLLFWKLLTTILAAIVVLLLARLQRS
jgi:serine/threonine protein kinase